VPAGTVEFDSEPLGMVLNAAGVLKTGLTVSIFRITRGLVIGEEAMIDDGMIGYAGREGTGEEATPPAAEVASVTGHTVVYNEMISVVTWPSFAGQFVTVGAQDVIV
jgi:hypothetical protein